MACSVVSVFVLCCSAIRAQEPDPEQADIASVSADAISNMVTPTPEMWLYLHQQQREDDPKMIVRRKAQFKAAARRNRIAALKWFGYSNQRPRANPTPFMATYSPAWSGNYYTPYWWIGSGTPYVAVHVHRYETTR